MAELNRKYDNTKSPWVSICIPTYCRQDFLRKTLGDLLQQTMPDFEIIVSDNDPAGSGQRVVDEISDKRIRYFCNQENVGMVKNTNLALSRAIGEYVVFLPDDDSLYPEMLATLRDLTEKYPGFGAYFGAVELNIMHPDAVFIQGLPLGKTSFIRPDLPLSSIRIFTAEEFPYAFLSTNIFPAVFWAGGVVKRSIALAVGGVPNYGSNLMFDHAYLLLVGTKAGCVTINRAVCCQNMHGHNATYRDFVEFNACLQGFYRSVVPQLAQRDDWKQLHPQLEKYLGNFIVGYSMILRRSARINKNKLSLSIFLLRIIKPPYTRPIFWKYLTAAHAPFLFPTILPIYLWIKQNAFKLKRHRE